MSLERYEGPGGLAAEAYSHDEQALNAIRSLVAGGFDRDQVSVLARDEDRASRLAESTGTDVIGEADTDDLTEGPIGALDRALMGVITVAIPGMGVFVFGPLATIIGGADSPEPAEALADILAASRVPEDEARRLEQRLAEGDIVVAVHPGDRKKEARRILAAATGAPQ